MTREPLPYNSSPEPVQGCLHVDCKVLKVKRYSSPEQVISELRGVTCHIGSHSVTGHPPQVNSPGTRLFIPTFSNWRVGTWKA